MDQDIEKDFLHELSIAKFPHLNLFRSNARFRQDLLTEFKLLTTKPKLHLYFKEHISDDEWAKAMTYHPNELPNNSSQPIAASFVAMSETEKLAHKVIDDFNKMVINQNLKPKYYGRFLEDTQTVKLIRSIDEQCDEFRKYVILDSNVDNYKNYASAAIDNIVRSSSKIQIHGLGNEILSSFLAITAKTDIHLQAMLYGRIEQERDAIITRYNILKTLTDQILNKELNLTNAVSEGQVPLFANRSSIQREPTQREVTITDRMLRELDLIRAIFEAQYNKYDNNIQFPYPSILGPDGRSGIDGRYIHNFDLLSDEELFNIQIFKEQITKRYEAAQNLTVLHNQIDEIRKKAYSILKYYEEKLTRGNKLVDDFLLNHSRPLSERANDLQKNKAVVTVQQIQVGMIVFGVRISDYEGDWLDTRRLPYRYILDNFLLAQVCSRVVDFADKFREPVNVNNENGYVVSQRYFSFDLNNYRFTTDPELSDEENQQMIWKYRQLVLETIFKSKFRKSTAENLVEFLDSQYELTPAPKEAFIQLVEKIGNDNLQNTYQGSSIPKADVFRVWIEKKKKNHNIITIGGHINLHVDHLNIETTVKIDKVVAENGGQVNIADFINHVEPPKPSN